MGWVLRQHHVVQPQRGANGVAHHAAGQVQHKLAICGGEADTGGGQGGERHREIFD